MGSKWGPERTKLPLNMMFRGKLVHVETPGVQLAHHQKPGRASATGGATCFSPWHGVAWEIHTYSNHKNERQFTPPPLRLEPRWPFGKLDGHGSWFVKPIETSGTHLCLTKLTNPKDTYMPAMKSYRGQHPLRVVDTSINGVSSIPTGA